MLKNFYNDESGQGMVEYGLLVALIAVAAIAAIRVIGGSLSTMFNSVAGDLEGAAGGTGGAGEGAGS